MPSFMLLAILKHHPIILKTRLLYRNKIVWVTTALVTGKTYFDGTTLETCRIDNFGKEEE